tara:strand:- start:536 stop:1033 length:498 start_codon:yes stop_codon:yes gene_type:complete
MIDKYGFETFQNRETSFNLYSKVEDFFQDTHNYLKYLKFGYGRVTDQVSTEIRNQRMTREEGIEYIKKYEHNIVPNNLKAFCEFAGLSKEEFLENIEHLRDMSMWKKNRNSEWEILDWIGNHITDEGIEESRLVIKEKWDSLKSKKYLSPRKPLQPNNGEDMVFL